MIQSPVVIDPGDPPVASRVHLPVTVVLERREVARGRWTVPSWSLAGVVLGDSLAIGQAADTDSTAVGPAADRPIVSGRELIWTGRHVTLYKDACERYWHALIGDRPRVYTICREHETAGVEPFLVTIDYDEAAAYGEHDELVLATDITPELYRYMEAFVLAHYRPKPFEKRKRRNWSEGEHDAARRPPTGGRAS